MKAEIKRNRTILITAETLCEAYILKIFSETGDEWAYEVDYSILSEAPAPDGAWSSDSEVWDEDKEEWG
jgi:hypothetical protein